MLPRRTGRLPRRKPVTIAIGMIGRQAVVLASDTQESAGYFKGNVEKTDSTTVWSASELPRSFSIAGAGYGPFIDNISPVMSQALQEHGKDPDKQSGVIEACLSDFYSSHIDLPNVDSGALEIALLVGTYVPGATRLYKTNRTTATRCHNHAAVGIGETVANRLLAEVHDPLMPIDSMVIAAAYVVWKVNNSVRDCGNDTDITVITPTRVVTLARTIPHSWAPIFVYLDGLTSYITRSVFDHRGEVRHIRKSDVDVNESIETFRKELREKTANLTKELGKVGLKIQTDDAEGTYA
jgi:hypothetical protein